MNIEHYKDYKREIKDIGNIMEDKKKITIAIDFDGTLVKHHYPKIGDEVPNAIDLIKDYTENYNVVWILNTMRSGKLLDEAVKWCEKHKITLYGINHNPSQDEWTESTKTYAQFYIDDSNVGCPLIFDKNERPYVDWEKIDKSLKPILKYLNS